MTLKTSDLRAALAQVSVVSRRRTTHPVLSCVLLNGVEAGLLGLSATSFEEWAYKGVQAEGALDQCCVPIQRLSDQLAYAGDEVALTLKGDLLTVKGRGVANIKTLPAKSFPDSVSQNSTLVGVNCGDLAKCIEAVSWAALGHGVDDYVLQGVHIVCGPTAIKTEATNRKVYAGMSLPAIAAAADFVVPGEFSVKLCEALRWPNAVLRLGSKYAEVHGNGSYYCKLTEERYLDFSKPLSAPRDELGTLEAKEWIEPLRAAHSMQLDGDLWRGGFITNTSLQFTNATGEDVTYPLPSKLKRFDKPAKIDIAQWLKALPRFGDGRITMSEAGNSYFLSNNELTISFPKFRV